MTALSLAVGTRVGPHEITGSLGAGGIGEVYRARDTQLNRDVAIKVLPELFAQDQESLARFTREAQTLAALNAGEARKRAPKTCRADCLPERLVLQRGNVIVEPLFPTG